MDRASLKYLITQMPPKTAARIKSDSLSATGTASASTPIMKNRTAKNRADCVRESIPGHEVGRHRMFLAVSKGDPGHISGEEIKEDLGVRRIQGKQHDAGREEDEASI